jgi:hypothetical protein
VSLPRWLAEFLDEQFSISGKVPRTLRALLLRPGYLTAEWLQGRRTAHVAPLRLYILAAAVFFALLALTPSGTEMAEGAASGFSRGMAGDTTASPDLMTWLERIQNDPAYAGALGGRVLENFPRAMFLVLPLLALVIKALHRTTPGYFIGHLVFTLHLQAFVFVLALPLVPLMNVTGSAKSVASVIGGMTFLAMCIYLYLALRTVYHASRSKTAIRMLAIIVADTFLRALLATGMALAFA